MKYILISGNRVTEIIQNDDPVFPGIPIEDRYSPEFLAQCVPVDDAMEVKQNWIYEGGSFTPPPEPEPVPEDAETADDVSAETEEYV